MSDPQFDESLRDFLTEADEHLESLNQHMLSIEGMLTAGVNLDVINTMFRNAHSLKGMSGMMGFARVNRLTHKMENILDLVRNGQLTLTQEIIDVIFASFDVLQALLGGIRDGSGEQADIEETVTRIAAVIDRTQPAASAAPEPEEKQLTVSAAVKAELSVMDEINIGIALNGGERVFEVGLRLDRDCFSRHLQPLTLYKDLEALGEIHLLLPVTKLPATLDEFMPHEFDFEIRLLLATPEDADGVRAVAGDAAEVLPVTMGEPVPAAAPAPPVVTAPADAPAPGINPEYVKVFIDESGEDVVKLNETLIAYEQDTGNADHVNALFRLAHRLKSSAAAIGLKDLAQLLHSGENILDRIRGGKLQANDSIVSLLLQMADVVAESIEILRQGGVPDMSTADLAARLSAAAGTVAPAAAPPVPAAPAAAAAPAAERRAGEERRAGGTDARKVAGDTIRVDVERLDELMNLTGELVINRARIFNLITSLRAVFERKDIVFTLDDVLYKLETLQAELHGGAGASTVAAAAQDIRRIDGQLKELFKNRQTVGHLLDAAQQLNRLSTKVQNGVMQARMLPIGQIFRKFTRLVRDLSRSGGKKIRLDILGEDTELDKSVIDELNDPLTHMLRNSLDHGVEAPADRVAAGKPEEGVITLNAYHAGNQVCIEIRDDGKGIDTAAVGRKAVEKGLVTEAELAAMPEQEIIRMIFLPGFSTAKTVTDISGRGVGMDVVMHQVKKLNGAVEIRSVPGQGTVMQIYLPLTLAIIDAMLFRVGEAIFALPIENAAEVISVAAADMHTIEGNATIKLRDRTLSVVQLADCIGTGERVPEAARTSILVVDDGSQRLGVVISAMLGKEEVVVKPLGDEFKQVGGVSGATILGNGAVALIIDAAGVVRRAVKKA